MFLIKKTCTFYENIINDLLEINRTRTRRFTYGQKIFILSVIAKLYYLRKQLFPSSILYIDTLHCKNIIIKIDDG